MICGEYIYILYIMDKVTGIQNIGNTCYLNSSLQLIVNCDKLTNIFIKNTLYNNFLNVYKDFLIQYQNNKVFSPNKLKNTLSEQSTKFIGLNQEDSHEFIILLFEFFISKSSLFVKISNPFFSAVAIITLNKYLEFVVKSVV